MHSNAAKTTAPMATVTVTTAETETANTRDGNAPVPDVCLKSSGLVSFEYVVVLGAGDGAERCLGGIEEEEELYSFLLERWTGAVFTVLGILVEVLVVGLMDDDCCGLAVDATPLVLYPVLVASVFVQPHPVTA